MSNDVSMRVHCTRHIVISDDVIFDMPHDAVSIDDYCYHLAQRYLQAGIPVKEWYSPEHYATIYKQEWEEETF